ncbi:hypothetical protein ACWGI0_31280 [Streptomyces sp. NPDC054802]
MGFTAWKFIGDSESSGKGPSGQGSGEKGASRPKAKSGTQLWSIPDFVAGSGATAADGTVYFGVNDDFQGATFILYALAL